MIQWLANDCPIALQPKVPIATQSSMIQKLADRSRILDNNNDKMTKN